MPSIVTSSEYRKHVSARNFEQFKCAAFFKKKRNNLKKKKYIAFFVTEIPYLQKMQVFLPKGKDVSGSAVCVSAHVF